MFWESSEVDVLGIPRMPVKNIQGEWTWRTYNVSVRPVPTAPPHARDDRQDAGTDAAAAAGRGRRWRGPRAPRVR